MNYIPNIPRTVMDVFKMLPEGTRCEIIDDALHMLPSPTTTHQEVLADVAATIYQFVESNNSGDLFIGPLDVYLNDNIVQPDILFIGKAYSSIIHKNGIHGTPDFIIEILSSNVNYDKKKKFELYQKNQIPEYIIIDPENKNVWHYLLQNGSYEQVPSADGQLTVKSINAQFTF